MKLSLEQIAKALTSPIIEMEFENKYDAARSFKIETAADVCLIRLLQIVGNFIESKEAPHLEEYQQKIAIEARLLYDEWADPLIENYGPIPSKESDWLVDEIHRPQTGEAEEADRKWTATRLPPKGSK